MDGTCARCGRRLSDADSVRLGMGPVCREKSGGGRERRGDGESDEILSVPTDDVVLKRVGNGVATNVPHVWTLHSPTGFEWGYGGSGPADLALNILLKFGCTRAEAEILHQEFKWKYIAGLPEEGATIAAGEIREWIEARRMAAKRGVA